VNAIPLFVDDAPTPSTTIGATVSSEFDIQLQQCDGETFDIGTSGVWFELTGNGGTLKFTTCTSSSTAPSQPHRISIHQGSGCDSLICTVSAVEEDPDCANPNSSHAKIRTNPGERYFILVHDETRSDTGGNFDFSVEDVTQVPRNDECTNAAILNTGVTESGTTLGATEKSIGTDCNVESSRGVWYKIERAQDRERNGMIVVFLCSNSQNLTVSAIKGNSCGIPESCTATSTAHNFEFDCASGEEFATAISWVSSPDSEYLILIHGANESLFGVAYTRILVGTDDRNNDVMNDNDSSSSRTPSTGFLLEIIVCLMACSILFN
jgi:hypothetical protein